MMDSSGRTAVPSIKRLDEAVVNRIAAGEVIQRPASALKELLENSLDAGATSISVVVKEGGLKLIQISDNGHGISYEDLPILCERHTTSKINSYEDLQTITTLGFRGEALASMTFVAHLTVITMTEGQIHGYRVSYKDGAMEGEPRPCAAIKGTQIMVENLFYNVIARKKAFKNPSEEYSRILDVISRYAIQKIGVSFSCKKHGDSRTDIHTDSTSSRTDAIRAVYGPGVARELVSVTASDDDPSHSIFKMDGYISSANYSAKKTTMVLFINDRLVECSSLKKAIEVVYAAILPKASKPFLYISIAMPPEHVDINIHPTKREVSFLNQESLIDSIQKAIEAKLMQSNTTRTFYTQTLLSRSLGVPDEAEESMPVQTQGGRNLKAPVNKLVRTDPSNPAGRMLAFMQKSLAGHVGSGNGLVDTNLNNRPVEMPMEDTRKIMDLTKNEEFAAEVQEDQTGAHLQNNKVHKIAQMDASSLAGREALEHNISQANEDSRNELTTTRRLVRQRRNLKERAELTSIQELLATIDQETHSGLEDIVKHCTFIGMADERLCFVQHKTYLYLLDIVKLSKELLYQQVLRRFGHFNVIQLSNAASLYELLVIALDEEEQSGRWHESDGPKDQIAQLNVELLMCKAQMLQEYFNLSIDESANLCTLPLILDQYTPDMDRLPQFVLNLGNNVDWETEKECFDSVAAAIGEFYAIHPPLFPRPSVTSSEVYQPAKAAEISQVPRRLETDVNSEPVQESVPQSGADEPEVEDEFRLEAENAWAQREWTIQHVLFPAMKLFLKPPHHLANNGAAIQVARLENLYKIFERC
ncbi:hypothetical protein O6H91_01G046000 [Diphasiastrum complanatum]|uniref:Uncharacterized protein n=1 Tax=Diphasiastrum complanatum TaxID=34168 RepID=A0ACC2EQM8_DIPCM|nr:hypothetical protein O6H91_01G046000 [Diphasiastrum complanatum]